MPWPDDPWTVVPFVQYTGPEELRREWIKRAVELVHLNKTITNNLPSRQLGKRYSDGSTIHTETVTNGSMRVDVVRINVPYGKEGVLKERSERIIPMFDMTAVDTIDPEQRIIEGVYTWMSPAFEKIVVFLKDGREDSEKTINQERLYAYQGEEKRREEISDFEQGLKNLIHVENVDPNLAAYVSGGPGDWTYSGSQNYYTYIKLPDDSIVQTGTYTYGVSTTITQTIEYNEALYFLLTTYGDVNLSWSGDVVALLDTSYIEESGNYAYIYTRFTYDAGSDFGAGYGPVYGQGSEEEPDFDTWQDLFPVSGTFKSGVYNLYLVTCMGGEINEIDLGVTWDNKDPIDGGSEYEVITAFVNVYPQNVVVYSYLVSSKFSVG